MKPFIAITALLIHCSVIFCQDDIQKSLMSDFHQVLSIDPQQINYADLERIGEAIGNARIVFLGEQDHGDAPAFLAKTRLIKYLHEKLGFDVLAFESDFWGLNEVWNNRHGSDFASSQIMNNTYDIWSKCLQTQELYQYIEQAGKTNKPLHASGIDCRHASQYSKTNYFASISAFTATAPSFIIDTSSLTQFLTITKEIIDKEYDSKATKKEKDFFLTYIDAHMPGVKDQFWKQEFKNLKYAALNSWGKLSSKTVTRDVSMADNLLWLYREKYKGSKIIVWAHSGHIAKNIGSVPKQTTTSLGNEVFKFLGDSIYILGFTSLEGKAGRVQLATKFEVEKVKPNSFEDLVSTKNFEYGFINFKTLNISTAFDMKAIDHIALKANWTKVFDGVFYIKTMYPCDKVN